MSDYISMFYMDVIANPNTNPDDGLANLCLYKWPMFSGIAIQKKPQ